MFHGDEILTYALAYKQSAKIAAFASLAVALPVLLKLRYKPQTSTSMLTLDDTDAQLVPYEGRQEAKSRLGELVFLQEYIKLRCKQMVEYHNVPN